MVLLTIYAGTETNKIILMEVMRIYLLRLLNLGIENLCQSPGDFFGIMVMV